MTTSLNIRSTDLEKSLVNSNTIFQEAVAGNEEEQSTEIEEPEQNQPPDCEKTTAGCPSPGDEEEGTVPLPTKEGDEVISTEAPAESPTTGEPSIAQLPTADGESSTTGVVPPLAPTIPPETVVPYTCSTTFYDPPRCTCVGINDCKDLRLSGECKTGTEPTGKGEVGSCPWKGKH